MRLVSNKYLFLFLLILFSEAGFAQLISTGMTVPSSSFGFVFLNLQSTNALTVDSFDVEYPVAAIGSSRVQVWVTRDRGPYAGRENNPADWELIGTADANLVMMPFGNWTSLSLDLGLFLKPGSNCGIVIFRGINSGTLGNMTGAVQVAEGMNLASSTDLVLKSGLAARYFDRTTGGSVPYGPNLNVHYTVHPSSPVQLRMNRIIAPVYDDQDCGGFSANETVSIELLNIGSSSISPGTVIPLQASVNGGGVINDTFVVSTAIPPNGTASHTFSPTIDMSRIGKNTLRVSHMLGSDTYAPDNDLAQDFFNGSERPVSEFPWEENFDDVSKHGQFLLPLGWVQERLDASGLGSEWRISTGAVFGTGASSPLEDHTVGIPGLGGFVEMDNSRGQAGVAMRSPCLDLSSLASPECRFWLHANSINGGFDNFAVDVFDSSTGQVTADVFGPIVSLGPGWQMQTVDLSSFSGKQIRLIFRGSSNSSNLQYCVDDVAVYDASIPDGQAPQASFASLQVGRTINSQGFEMPSTAPGPYYSFFAPGESMNFEFTGEPNQPVMLLGGLLNPRVATFPPIGALDVGTILDPASGIPTDITVLADGNLTFGVNPLFNTGVSGTGTFGVTAPNLPPGILTTFQCVIRTTGANGSYIALSNAVQVIIE